MTAATTAQRQAALKARRKAAGLVRVAVWVHQDWVGVIRTVEKRCKQPNPEDLTYMVERAYDVSADECDQLL